MVFKKETSNSSEVLYVLFFHIMAHAMETFNEMKLSQEIQFSIVDGLRVQTT